jgi:hypothetical protein
MKKVVGKQLMVAMAAIGLMSAAPAWAGFSQGNSVTLGGTPVFSIAGSANGMSPDHRAWITQDRLDNALVLSADKSANAVTVSGENVFLGGRLVATADLNSARLEGTSPAALAAKYADGIRSFLSDSARASAYVAELTGKNPIQAQVAVLERRIYAPPGTILPVAFATAITADTLAAGQRIEGTLTQDVAFGQYVLPASSTVIGVVTEGDPGRYSLAFNTLRTPNGTLLPIAANMTGEFLGGSLAPHAVATEELPYGSKLVYQGVWQTNCRMPSTVGIGTLGGGRTERLVLRHGSGLVIAAGTPMSIVFDTPQQVAVVLRTPAM